MDELINQEFNTKQGYKIKIIEANKKSDIVVEFQDETKVTRRTTYQTICSGHLMHPNTTDLNKNTRRLNFKIGESIITKFGIKTTLIEYINSENVMIMINDDVNYIVCVSYHVFKNGNTRTLLDKTIYGRGFIGLGEIEHPYTNNFSKTAYKLWYNMFVRCYQKEYQDRFPTYIGCSVCDKWHSFNNFYVWFKNNYYTIKNEKMCVDKDIIVKNNKIYSPETCVVVPNRINTLIINAKSVRGNLPVGVTMDGNSFKTTCGFKDFVRPYTSYHKNKTEAFEDYKHTKEYLIKKVADEYRDFIPKKLYESLYNYEVTIDD